MRSAVHAAGRHLTAADVDEEMMGFVSQRLMIYADIIEVAINGTTVHRSDPLTWTTQDSNCPTNARYIDSARSNRMCTLITAVASIGGWGGGGRARVGRVGNLHGPPKILVGWATMHLVPPIIGLYVRSQEN